MKTTTQDEIIDFCNNIKDTLLKKNKEYGDSALNPIRLFSTTDRTEQIRVRIDDKLSRINNRGHKDIKEDTLADLIGYLILLRIAEKRDAARRNGDVIKMRDIKLITEIILRNGKYEAPFEIKRSGKWYECTIPIGNDHVAYLAFPDDTFKEICKLNLTT